MLLVLAMLAVGCSDQNSEPQAPRKQSEAPQPPPPTTTQTEEQPKTWAVGVVGPESGEGSEFGLQVLEGIRMAAEDFNARDGGKGPTIQVLHEDNKNSPDQTNHIVEQMVEQKVMAIFAAPTGWSTFLPVHLANASHTLFMAVGTPRRIAQSDSFIFHFSLSEQNGVEELVKHAITREKWQSFALVTSSIQDDSLDVSALFKRIVPAEGGEIVAEVDTYDSFTGQENVAQVIDALKKSPKPPQAVIFTGQGEQGAELASAMAKAGLKLPLLGGETLFSPAMVTAGAVPGSLVYTAFAPDRDAPEVAGFGKKFQTRTGHPPDRFAALAYDAMLALSQAMLQAGAPLPSRVRQSLISGNIQGITGKTGFTVDGMPVKQAFLYRIQDVGSGKHGFVLLK